MTILQNPPYSGNLHLKILQEAIKHADKTVNLSPIRWLQDPFKEYKKSCDYKRFSDVREHIEKLDTIDKTDAWKLFSIQGSDLGLYEMTPDKCNYQDVFGNSLLAKVTAFCWEHRVPVELSKKDGWRVKWPITAAKAGHNAANYGIGQYYLKTLKYFKDGMKEGKYWYEYYNRNKYSKTTPEITYSVPFNTETEADNFCKSMKTKFELYCQEILVNDIHINDYSVPYMGEVVNPLTGKKGYESEWTDEAFYKYFEITEEEQKIIEETMEKYK